MAKRFLTLDEVAANAMLEIPDATAEHRNIFKQWAWLALRDIGPTNDYIEIAVIQPINFTVEKPEDFIMGAGLALYDDVDPDNGNELYYKFRQGKQRIHEDVLGDLSNNIEVSEDAFFYYLSSNATIVESVKLRYYKFPLDANGLPLVPEVCLMALISFIAYKWEARNNNSRLAMRDFYQIWKQERAAARSRLRPVDMITANQIAKEWRSMIANVKFDNF